MQCQSPKISKSRLTIGAYIYHGGTPVRWDKINKQLDLTTINFSCSESQGILTICLVITTDRFNLGGISLASSRAVVQASLLVVRKLHPCKLDN